MNKIIVAGQEALVIKNQDQFMLFYIAVIERIKNEDHSRLWIDRFAVCKDELFPKSYPALIVAHPESSLSGKLPWYFITEDQVADMTRALNEPTIPDDYQFSDRFLKER